MITTNNKPSVSFEDFIAKIDFIYSQNPTLILRYGQCVMNVLYDIWPEKYEELTNSNYDCFYNDSTAYKILDMLEKNWK